MGGILYAGCVCALSPQRLLTNRTVAPVLAIERSGCFGALPRRILHGLLSRIHQGIQSQWKQNTFD